ncbi:L-threonylcarbamoyladenylate synthase [uncultured Eubacterium sp.]|uniref:L-threonylcarbamoyladenylate synthase n=1 Tax=uncultured Eubacterium sp. TaxID=165185 RepID=UPI0028040CC5|nr:L-threonylcarbamoyladenylate synthase [uncultured Eubacterium sp.]
METKLFGTSEYDIAEAGKMIAEGKLVAFPTETVYGLGANALNEEAVRNIYLAKGRPSDNPLIVHIAEKEDIVPLVKEVTPKAKALIDAFFPAPLTIILNKSDKVGKVVSGGLDTVAVRMPKNEIARKLIKASGCPIAAPSANTSGLPSPTRVKYVIDDMMGKIDGIIDGGDCEYGVESTVITLATDVPTLLRPGAITKEMIEAVIGEITVAPAVLEGMKNDEVAASPGMKYKHYAPKAKVVIVNADKKEYEKFVNAQKGAFALCFDDDEVTIPKVTFGRENDDLSQAKELFDALRELDEMGAKKVYARIPHKDGVGMAVYNRLIRAAAFCIIDLTKPFTVGLTGPTGAGKSYVCKIFRQKGFKIIDCDKIAHELTAKNAPILTELASEFGEDVVKNGELDRKLLASRAFDTKEHTKKLNSILHPAIAEKCKEEAQGLTVLDASQLFEANMQNDCYKVIGVLADEDVRIKRIIARDNITEQQAKLRMSAQFDNDYFIDNCDYIIYNNGEDIAAQTDNILEVIL